MPETKLLSTLRSLSEGGVQFILVGGLAAVLQGAPIQTYDIDLVYSREPANRERLLKVLDSLDAFFRIQPERRLRPAESHLAGGGHLNLLTRYGPLDLLGAVGRDLGFDDLLSHSVELSIGEGIVIRVLNLESIIALKEDLAGEKDLAVLPLLRQTLREISKKQQS
jgi:predicted nucleotidyltransferase